MTKFLTEGLLSEINRGRDLIATYQGLPDGSGLTEASHIKKNIQDAEKAISEGDIPEMLICFKKLKYSD